MSLGPVKVERNSSGFFLDFHQRSASLSHRNFWPHSSQIKCGVQNMVRHIAQPHPEKLWTKDCLRPCEASPSDLFESGWTCPSSSQISGGWGNLVLISVTEYALLSVPLSSPDPFPSIPPVLILSLSVLLILSPPLHPPFSPFCITPQFLPIRPHISFTRTGLELISAAGCKPIPAHV